MLRLAAKSRRQQRDHDGAASTKGWKWEESGMPVQAGAAIGLVPVRRTGNIPWVNTVATTAAAVTAEARSTARRGGGGTQRSAVETIMADSLRELGGAWGVEAGVEGPVPSSGPEAIAAKAIKPARNGGKATQSGLVMERAPPAGTGSWGMGPSKKRGTPAACRHNKSVKTPICSSKE